MHDNETGIVISGIIISTKTVILIDSNRE